VKVGVRDVAAVCAEAHGAVAAVEDDVYVSAWWQPFADEDVDTDAG
jgi:hypothetical protein